MSIKNNKTATELLSLILSLMDDDDRAELRAAMGNDDTDHDHNTEPDEDELERVCAEYSSCNYCPYDDYCHSCVDEDEDDDPEDEDDDALTIKITIPDGMPCIVMGGTDDELPLAMELIKEMGLVSPAPAPAKSRVRGEMVNRNQSVPEGSISCRTLREMIDRIAEELRQS